MKEVRCKNCNKKLGEELEGSIKIVCPKCKHYNSFSSGYKSHKLLSVLERSVG